MNHNNTANNAVVFYAKSVASTMQHCAKSQYQTAIVDAVANAMHWGTRVSTPTKAIATHGVINIGKPYSMSQTSLGIVVMLSLL
jgi:hypothetical protein